MAAAYRAVSDDAESFGFGRAFLVRTGSPSGTSFSLPSLPFFSFIFFVCERRYPLPRGVEIQ